MTLVMSPVSIYTTTPLYFYFYYNADGDYYQV